MSEMIERVAKAISTLKFSVVLAATNGGDADAAAEVARAAIEAMREPTEAGSIAGAIAIDRCDGDCGRDEADDCWRAMIDAALST